MSDKPTLAPKGRYLLKYRGTQCANCGHLLDISDRFCPNCSQANSTKKLTLKDFIDEFLSSMISYDSKLLKTLSSLLLRPGKITKDYINGKRVSYTNPFRFLLSLAIVYFLILNFTGNYASWDNSAANKIDNNSKIADLLEVDLQVENREQTDSIRLSDPRLYFSTLQNLNFNDRFYKKSDLFSSLILKDTIYTFDAVVQKYKIENTYENKIVFNATKGYKKIRRQPGSFISTVISKLPFAIFFFLPAFTLFIWLAYIRKKYNYTDHLIFAFHNTSLLFILLIISYLIDAIFGVNSNWIFVLIFSMYLFFAMRKFYQQGVFKTIVKYLFLNGIFFILAIIGILLLSTGSLVTY
ncbi:MAG: DUF3667 domain-containing protein [Flavobacteriaceae bacterium]